MAAIRFVLPWRGREPGDIDTQLDHGVAVELVRRKIAVEVDQEPAPAKTENPKPAKKGTQYRR